MEQQVSNKPTFAPGELVVYVGPNGDKRQLFVNVRLPIVDFIMCQTGMNEPYLRREDFRPRVSYKTTFCRVPTEAEQQEWAKLVKEFYGT